MITFFVTVFVVALVAAFASTYRDPYSRHRPFSRTWSLWHTGVHTEYCGPGRVWFISFFRGRGYVVWLHRGRGGDGKPLDAPGWRPNIYIPGFTFYWRTHESKAKSSYGKPVKKFRLDRGGNKAVV